MREAVAALRDYTANVTADGTSRGDYFALLGLTLPDLVVTADDYPLLDEAVAALRKVVTLATSRMLHRTSRRTGTPIGALIWVGAGSLLTLLVVIKEPRAGRAVAISLSFGSDLIIAAYILVVAAANIFTIRRRMPPSKR